MLLCLCRAVLGIAQDPEDRRLFRVMSYSAEDIRAYFPNAVIEWNEAQGRYMAQLSRAEVSWIIKRAIDQLDNSHYLIGIEDPQRQRRYEEVDQLLAQRFGG